VTEKASKNSLLELARFALDNQNYSEAEGCYTKLLETDPTLAEGWYGKGYSAGMQSTLQKPRVSESLSAFTKALSLAQPDERGSLLEKITVNASSLITRHFHICYAFALNYYNPGSSVRAVGAWLDYVDESRSLLHAIDCVRHWNPDCKSTYMAEEAICRALLEGIPYMSDTGQKCYFPKETFHAEIAHRHSKSELKIASFDPLYKPKPLKPAPEHAACFVVTATMGSPAHPYVTHLQDFRERVLRTNSTGRLLIGIYNSIGPLAADQIRGKRLLIAFSYYLIVLPGVFISGLLLKRCRNK
jgi:tetratricopeptide (TPR) repeat protein